MKAVIRIWLLLSLALTLNAGTPPSDLRITVQVYNYAQLSPETLARAEREAARIYRQIGLETEWLDCPLSPEEAARYPACQLPAGPTRLALRVLSRPMAERLRLGKKTFGLAQIPEDGGFGFAAYVCSHRAKELAKGRDSLHAVVLGHLMAHEIGHLLLGADSHSASGLMHVPWHKKELELVSQGSMLFTPWQAKEIRTQVHERMRAEVEARWAAAQASVR